MESSLVAGVKPRNGIDAVAILVHPIRRLAQWDQEFAFCSIHRFHADIFEVLHSLARMSVRARNDVGIYHSCYRVRRYSLSLMIELSITAFSHSPWRGSIRRCIWPLGAENANFFGLSLSFRFENRIGF
jgi:hypothetical protein